MTTNQHEFDEARTARRILDVKMPGTKENIFPWLEVVTGGEARFTPVIRRILFNEGEYVQRGEPIIELEQNEYFTSSLGHLLAPETGIIRKFHVREGREMDYIDVQKHKYIGDRQYHPNYGATLVSMELEHPHNLSDQEISKRLVKELVANGVTARKRNMRNAVGNILLAGALALIVIFVLARSMATGWWSLLLVPLVLIIAGLAALSMRYSARKYSKNKAFDPLRAFGLE